MKLYKAAVITCDEHDGGQKCTEAATYREPIHDNTELDFAANARRYFAAKGWSYSRVACFCPKHNAVAPAPV